MDAKYVLWGVVITQIGGIILALINRGKLSTIEHHTNGINARLQEKIDKAEVDKESTAALVEKDKEIALRNKDQGPPQ